MMVIPTDVDTSVSPKPLRLEDFEYVYKKILLLKNIRTELLWLTNIDRVRVRSGYLTWLGLVQGNIPNSIRLILISYNIFVNHLTITVFKNKIKIYTYLKNYFILKSISLKK